MAEVTFVQIDDSNIIVGVHSVSPNLALLPAGHTIVQKTTEDPQSLVGIPDSLIDEDQDKRPLVGVISEKELLRSELKRLSIEIDLAQRMSESTTALQDDFDAKKIIYDGLP